MTQIAKVSQGVVRSLKTLIPLLQEKLKEFHRANLDWYRDMGALLIEAKEQVPRGSWPRWLRQNFDIAERTAQEWMQVSRSRADGAGLLTANDSADLPASKYEALGKAARHAKLRKRKRPLEQAMRDLDAELFAQEEQAAADEVRLHREIALKFVDLGYRAMAMRLHPDHGGSADAMRRLMAVRDVFQSIAETRRFV